MLKLKTNEKNGYERYRKLYFDWLNSNYGIEVFIIGFYKSKSNNSIVEGKFKIPYVEYQMCVFEKERIRRPYEVISK